MHPRIDAPGQIGLVPDLTSPLWDEVVREPCYHYSIPTSYFRSPIGGPGAKRGHGSL